MSFRTAIEERITRAAVPVDKLSHQPRLYALAGEVGKELHYDDDILHAAAWIHDLGVFIGHRPADPVELARWDNTAYAMAQAPALLRECGFPEQKSGAVVEVIRTHQPTAEPLSTEAIILRDADILEQLGAVGILRTVAKIGRDTRFATFTEATASLRKSLETLPGLLRTARARELAAPKIVAMQQFLAAADKELDGMRTACSSAGAEGTAAPSERDPNGPPQDCRRS